MSRWSKFLLAARALPKVRFARIALIAMLLIFAIIVLSLLRQKSMMVDDALHIPSGYSYVITNDFRLNQEHPPFIKILSGLGLYRVRPELPLNSEGWQQAEQPGDPEDGTDSFSEDFFNRNAGKYEQITFWGRAPVVIMPLLLALAVWVLTKELFGETAALLAVLLLLSEPNVIGNSTIVQDDLAAALAIFLFVIMLRSYLKSPSVKHALSLGFVVGLALLIKHSLVVLVLISFVILLIHACWQKLKHRNHLCRFIALGLLVLCCSYIILIAGYAFHVAWIDEDEAQFISEWLHLSGNSSEAFQSVLLHLPILLPKYFLYGLDQVIHDVRFGRPAFLFGQVSTQGWWYYFPVAFALKTSLPFLSATLAGLVWTARDILKRRWADGLYLLVPPLLYLAMSMMSHLNIGVRHIIPVFPFFAVMGAGAITAFGKSLHWRRWKFSRIVPATIVLWCALLVFINYPNYLTYFSPLAGGTSNGWKLLSDSNVETGQEIATLAKYLKQHGTTKVSGIFMGSEYIKFYGIELCDLPCDEDEDEDAKDQDHSDQPAYVAIGAWYLQEVDVTPEQKAAIDPFRKLQPEAMVGNSIFVFRISNQDKRVQGPENQNAVP
jgi:hypothetical protein